MRKLITFLGLSKYEETTYSWGEYEHKTPYFAEAVAVWLKPSTSYVLLTPKAKESENWSELQERLSKYTQVEAIDIPSGQSQKELQQIFSKIDEVVNSEDELIFDITHGFRLLPLLTLLVIAYLRQVKNVRVERILYGAFEAKEAQDITPVFDLTHFVSLLDWLTAANIFMTTGDGSKLAALMEETRKQARKQAHQGSAPNPPKQLKTLACSIREVSENLLISRVKLLAESAQNLQSTLQESTLREKIQAWLPPLVPLFEQIEKQYAEFTQDDPPTQLRLIRWYEERGHLVQAYTLAREWLVNYELYRQGLWDSIDDRNAREEVEEQLNKEANRIREGDSEIGANQLATLWSDLRNYRNDIAHCGFRKGPLAVDKLRRRLQKIIDDLELLWQQELSG